MRPSAAQVLGFNSISKRNNVGAP